jgi:hypothetical protein
VLEEFDYRFSVSVDFIKNAIQAPGTRKAKRV